jgi:hypothetical protein
LDWIRQGLFSYLFGAKITHDEPHIFLDSRLLLSRWPGIAFPFRRFRLPQVQPIEQPDSQIPVVRDAGSK